MNIEQEQHTRIWLTFEQKQRMRLSTANFMRRIIGGLERKDSSYDPLRRKCTQFQLSDESVPRYELISEVMSTDMGEIDQRKRLVRN
jgi:hypothetical protein